MDLQPKVDLRHALKHLVAADYSGFVAAAVEADVWEGGLSSQKTFSKIKV